MIQSKTFRTAVPFASQMASSGKVLLAKPGTILGELVRLSTVGVNLTTTAAEGKSSLPEDESMMSVEAELIQHVTTGTLDDPTQHSLEIDGAVRDISKAVSAHISYAKNVVRPLVVSLAEGISDYASNSRPKDASSDFSVITLRVPSVLNDESFLDNLTRYKDKTSLTPDVSLSLDSKTKEELLALVMVGHTKTDKLIMEWVSQKDENFLEAIWLSFFTKLVAVNDGTALLTYSDVDRMNAFDKADCALAIYLLARKIVNEVQDTKGTLDFYKDTCNQYMDYAGTSLVQCINRIVTHTKSNTLVIDANNRKKTVKVNGELYGPWLDQGGSPEVLMGMLVSNETIRNTVGIQERSADFLRDWNSYCSLNNTRERNNSFDYMKAYLKSAFLISLKDKDALELEYIQTNSSYDQRVVSLLDSYINNLKPSDLTDHYGLALNMVAGIRFFYNSSYQILEDIRQIGLANPSVDVRDAALIATIYYVSDYVADQAVLTTK